MQKIELKETEYGQELFINDIQQFDTKWEYRYHEALIHPTASTFSELQSVLVLGGGDGLAVRELLKYVATQKITLVDCDQSMINLFRDTPDAAVLNGFSLCDEKVNVVVQDAYEFVENNTDKYDLIVCDFPDPSNADLEKLYSVEFYRLLQNSMHQGSIFVTQANSPYLAPDLFWSILNTIVDAGYCAAPYHNNVPSWGEWGYIAASKRPFRLAKGFLVSQRSLSEGVVNAMMIFGPDFSNRETKINRLEDSCVLDYYRQAYEEKNEARCIKI